jgi:hypothetical protein
LVINPTLQAKKEFELTDTIMDLKIEVGKLLNICPQLRKMMEISLIKIKRQGIVDICKVNIAKVDDLDVAMLVIQV